MRRYTMRKRHGFRRRRKVQWLPSIQWSAGGTAISLGAGPVFWPLEDPNNSLVTNASRLANMNDELFYQRIVGQLRFGLYLQGGGTPQYGDVVLDYGIAIVKGEYSPAGLWTINASDIPNPSNYTAPQDAAERVWLYKRQVILADRLVNTTSGFQTRPTINSTDDIGPQGSDIDLKPKRRAHYEEKLGIITCVNTLGVMAENYTIYMNPSLRVLIAKWG